MTSSPTDRSTHPAVILVATDLSDLDRLMQFALVQAAETGARLLLLHVLAAGEAMTVDAVGMPYYDPTTAIDSATATLREWCNLAITRNIPCDAVVREGNAAQQIVAASRQFHADRILLGTRSRSKMSKLLLGSVAEQVLRSVHIPVLTVGPEAHLPEPISAGQKVVVYATTLRESSRPSAALACEIAANQKARLVLLHVLPSVEELARKGAPSPLVAAADRELKNLAAETGAAANCCSIVESRVVHGNPSIEILAVASDLNASLIVLGATNRSAFQNLTRDRTIYRVLAHARCPVLTLREAGAAPQTGTPQQVAARV